MCLYCSQAPRQRYRLELKPATAQPLRHGSRSSRVSRTPSQLSMASSTPRSSDPLHDPYSTRPQPVFEDENEFKLLEEHAQAVAAAAAAQRFSAGSNASSPSGESSITARSAAAAAALPRSLLSPLAPSLGVVRAVTAPQQTASPTASTPAAAAAAVAAAAGGMRDSPVIKMSMLPSDKDSPVIRKTTVSSSLKPASPLKVTS